jgi:hypothetical protein
MIPLQPFLFIAIFIFTCFFKSNHLFSQGQDDFWNYLSQYCGMAYEGKVLEAPENDDFRGKRLIMHVRSCSEDVIKIPFLVGEDKSRTWVLTKMGDRIQLKHDHRYEDGSPDKITMYGGVSNNSGLPTAQFFPADEETRQLIDYAAGNVWWITIDDSTFTYNLRRMGTDRFFSVSFDLTKSVDAPGPPWGWED